MPCKTTGGCGAVVLQVRRDGHYLLDRWIPTMSTGQKLSIIKYIIALKIEDSRNQPYLPRLDLLLDLVILQPRIAEYTRDLSLKIAMIP